GFSASSAVMARTSLVTILPHGIGEGTRRITQAANARHQCLLFGRTTREPSPALPALDSFVKPAERRLCEAEHAPGPAEQRVQPQGVLERVYCRLVVALGELRASEQLVRRRRFRPAGDQFVRDEP